MPDFLNPVKRRTFVQQLQLGKVIPVISQQIIIDRLFAGYPELVKHYADYSGYPLPDQDNLLKMVSFMRVNNELTESEVRQDYLTFFKEHIKRFAQKQDGMDEDTLEVASEAISTNPGQSAGEFANSLGLPQFGEPDEDPFLILAGLQLPIYLTTSQHTFFEDALRREAKRKPRSEFCRWHRDLEEIPKVFDKPSFKLSAKEPIVFHLLGLDEHPESLVLTEDDYLQYLVAITRVGEGGDPIPSVIRSAFSTSIPVFLGFDLASWDFRTLFWGLIKPTTNQRQGAFTLQLEYSKKEQEYLNKYLHEEANLTIEWKDIGTYACELRDLWNSGWRGADGHG